MDKSRAPRVVMAAVAVCLLASFQGCAAVMGRSPVPAVTVVDAETGEPIEGAVAIAIWRKHSIRERAWWEGGTMVVVKIEEAVSDRDGNIYIDGFWGWYIAKNRYPRLTIYKFGYVCWDQNNIFRGGVRTDFDKDHRIARMEKWPEDFSFIRHESFIQNVTTIDYHQAPKTLFRDAIQRELPFIVGERYKKSMERKRKEEERREK